MFGKFNDIGELLQVKNITKWVSYLNDDPYHIIILNTRPQIDDYVPCDCIYLILIIYTISNVCEVHFI